MITIQEIRDYCLSLPETVELDHWGKPSFRIRNKIIAVFQPDGITLTIKASPEDKAIYSDIDPNVYRIPESFANMNYLNVHLPFADRTEVQGLIRKAWSSIAPKKLVKAYLER
ncbi:MmcQ/YjbR family DNA-binding protein [Cohnella suwonensis]|uniref:MmcQ/YjbR family DNA-binding protein n=1 Tax=Cohnella suwonensis TaxID=696072 RepID=A0ABW0M2J0_9BACL